MKENAKTDVELLLIAIAAESGTKTAFAEKIGKSRQALNDIIKNAKQNGGKLKPRFIQELKKMFDVDIYKWQPNPTMDFHSPNELSHMQVAEDDVPYGDKRVIEHLILENNDLRDRLNECEKKLRAVRNGKNSKV